MIQGEKSKLFKIVWILTF